MRNKDINLNSSVYFFTKAPPCVDYITYGDFLMIEILLDSPYNENEVEDLTSDQVKAVFTGETTEWEDLAE